jgi:predicted NBD/HSP70 family sugar kinase
MVGPVVSVVGTRRPPLGSGPGELLGMLRRGEAGSRSDLVRLTGLAASTVSGRVQALVREGYVREDGVAASTGGRPARRLEFRSDAGVVAAAEIGSEHLRLALADLAGHRLSTVELPLDIATGSDAVVSLIGACVLDQIRLCGQEPGSLAAIGVGLPAPVEAGTGRIVLPAHMPGWDGSDIVGLLRRWAASAGLSSDLPLVVGNDADLMAVAEHVEQAAGGADVEHLLAVRLGRRIGCGIISSGVLHVGAAGGAGEIAHTSVAGRPALACACASPNCLEAVASGGALVARLAAEGGPTVTPEELVALARDSDPAASRLLREAGSAIGDVLALVLNFFNPQVLVLGGALSQAAPLIAAVRGRVYENCLPLVTRDLQVVVSSAGPDAGVRGIFALLLDRVLDPVEVDRRVGFPLLAG